MAQDATYRVSHLQERSGDLGIETDLPVPQERQQVLPDVRHGLQLGEGQEPTGSLDRVDGPEHAGEKIAARWILFEVDHVLVELIQAFGALGHEPLEDFLHPVVEIAHLCPLPTELRNGSLFTGSPRRLQSQVPSVLSIARRSFFEAFSVIVP